MTKRLTLLTIHIFTLVLLLSINAAAQDRVALEKEIGALREQLKQKQEEFLAPSAEDRARFAEFLGQRDTGIARLMPREKYRDVLTIREGGAYYSFTKLSNSYDRDPQIGLEQEQFSTGFAGADFGFLLSLGDVPLESVALDRESTQYLAAFAPPNSEPEAREQQRRSAYGFAIGPSRYKGRLPVIVNGTYILRSISYERFDVLVAFRVVRQDTDGSVILLWKKLREFSTPYLARQ
jgi:hypothetical protein